MKRSLRPLGTLLALAAGCSGFAHDEATLRAEGAATRIYLGDVVTLDAAGSVAEAVALRDGRILAVGDRERVLAHRGPETVVVELDGAAVLPGFIDAHSHFVLHGVPFSGFANLSRPPVGGVASIPDIVAELRALARRSGARPGDWLVGYGYEREALIEEWAFDLYGVPDEQREKLGGPLYSFTDLPSGLAFVSILDNERDNPMRRVAFPRDGAWHYRTTEPLPHAVLLWMHDGQRVATDWRAA